jgi:hypothetical protein
MMPSFYYSPPTIFDATVAPIYVKADIAFSKWLVSHAQTNALYTADVRAKEVVFFGGFASTIKDIYVDKQDLLPGKYPGQYILCLDHMVKENSIVDRSIWNLSDSKYTITSSGRILTTYPGISRALLETPGVNLVYSSDRDYLFRSSFTWNPLANATVAGG